MKPDLLDNIDKTNIPKHIAIIMDGNGRWAKSKGQERTFGHRNAISAVRNAIAACTKADVEYLTLYTFSTENWKRPEDEVTTLMTLLSESIIKESDELKLNNRQFQAIARQSTHGLLRGLTAQEQR